MRTHHDADTPPLERIRVRLAAEIRGHERSLEGIADRLRYLPPDDPHCEVVYSIRAYAAWELAQAMEELAALDALVPS